MRTGPVTRPAWERFWEKVDISAGDDACWLWTAGRFRAGYGKFFVRAGEEVYAHRFMWQLDNGVIPDGYRICHTCDNPPCCNPRHLFLATMAVNMMDKVAKGRARGRYSSTYANGQPRVYA